jgi:hypothetical protein
MVAVSVMVLDEVSVGVMVDIVKAKHGALWVYCSQSPVKAMPAFSMV